MLQFISKAGFRTASLAITLLLAACVITTEKAYFDASDFRQLKVLAGDWVSVPSEPGDDILKVRMSANGKLWRAQPLTPAGEIDATEKPVDFGLVELGPGEYIVVQSDAKLGEGPVNYLGLKTEADKLNFYLFGGGQSSGGKAKFDALVASFGMSHDTSFSYEARLTGDITERKLKRLFRALLADPTAYDGHPAVYTRVSP
jgi:hypothetical protein